MKTRFLLPNKFKLIGWIILFPSTILGILILFFSNAFQFRLPDVTVFAIYAKYIPQRYENVFLGFTKVDITGTIIGILIILGGIFVAFAKEKDEDEFIVKLRLESFLWATYINYAILLFCFLFFYGVPLLYVMIINMFSIIILFIIRFHFMLYRSKKQLRHEEQFKS